jgi:hypothetical protein
MGEAAMKRAGLGRSICPGRRSGLRSTSIDLAAGIAIGLNDIHDDIVFSGPDPGKTD